MQSYQFVDETKAHEGTWLNWPHAHSYGKKYASEIEDIWIAMTKALSESENVHIVAYDLDLKAHIIERLQQEKIDLKRIDFVIAKSDDVWSRDTGPIFAFDKENTLTIVDFAFDGWGKKTPYQHDDKIPQAVAKAKNINLVTIDDFVLEGGSFEMSPDHSLMATRSSVISKNRNPNLSQQQAENYFRQYLGATNFIWLNGVVDEDITDAHIDGFARFYDEKTILTVPKKDFAELYEKVDMQDYQILTNAKNSQGEKYKIIEVPLTKKNVKKLGYKGSYLNFYVANEVLLLPIYADENDQQAIALFTKLYPNKKIVPINVSKLYKNGGMIHCVTQHQPKAKK